MTGATQHEAHYVDTRALHRVGAWVAITFIFVLTVMYVWWRHMPQPAAPRFVAVAGAKLQAHAPLDRQALLTAQRQRLSAYRWADADHRHAQVPIERAMAIVADDDLHRRRETQP